MAYPSTSLDGWFAKAKAGFRATVGAVVDIWPNPYAVIAKVLATISKEIDLRLSRLYRQIFVKDADPDYVVRHAFEYGIAPRPAGRATGTINATATGSGTVPAGAAFQRADGLVLVAISSQIVAAGAVIMAVQADAAGVTGNTLAGEALTLVSGGGGLLASGATVATGGIAGGTLAESTDELRARVLARKRNPPQGGNDTDWKAWAREVPGVSRVWVDSFSNTDRRVWLAFTMADRVDGIPNGGDIATVQAYLNDPVRRPITARVTVVAPTLSPVAVTASGVTPLTAAIEAAIRTELAALFLERMEVATPNRPFLLPRAWISEAISRAVGEDRHTLVAPATDVLFVTPGTLPALGTVNLS